MSNKSKKVVKELKDSIRYRSKHKEFIENFKYAIIHYFLEKYDAHIRVLTFVDSFGIEKNWSYYSEGIAEAFDFKFTIDILSDFCKEFECEFKYTSCDGSRYIFTFEDVDMSNAFFG